MTFLSGQWHAPATPPSLFLLVFFNDTATTEIYTLSLHDALPIWGLLEGAKGVQLAALGLKNWRQKRSEEHTSELQSQSNLVCRLLLAKKKKQAERGHDCPAGAHVRPKRPALRT